MEALLNIEKTQRLVRRPSDCAAPPRVAAEQAAAHLSPSQAADVTGTKMAVVAIVRACFQAKAWPALNENVLLISKRRSQLKQARGARGVFGALKRGTSPHARRAARAPQAIASMVQECMTFLDQTPDLDTKVALIKTLVTVSAGKACSAQRVRWLRPAPPRTLTRSRLARVPAPLRMRAAPRADLRGG